MRVCFIKDFENSVLHTLAPEGFDAIEGFYRVSTVKTYCPDGRQIKTNYFDLEACGKNMAYVILSYPYMYI